MELADTSAWHVARRRGLGPVAERFAAELVESRIATCDMVRLELLYSARSGREMTDVASELAVVPDCPIGTSEWKRALDVYQRLADVGGCHHRAVGHADLLIAAAAESVGATLLHYHEDFDRIAAITSQPTRWIVPRASV